MLEGASTHFYRSNFNPAFLAKARKRQQEAETIARRRERQIELERQRREKEEREQAEVQAKIKAYERLIRSDVKNIADRICKATGVSRKDLFSSRRHKKVVLVRQAICYWAARRTKFSYPMIGRKIGRDHTTVIHSVRVYPIKRKHMGRCLRPVRGLK